MFSNKAFMRDVRNNKVRPYVLPQFRRQIFDKFHSIAHPGQRASTDLIRSRLFLGTKHYKTRAHHPQSNVEGFHRTIMSAIIACQHTSWIEALSNFNQRVAALGDNTLQYASKYAFGYRIRDFHSGSDFGHEEKRMGKVTKGRYHVLLPDGRVQNVHYFADPSGYHAKVTYSDVAHH